MDGSSDPDADSNIGDSLVNDQNGIEGNLNNLISGERPNEAIEDLCSDTPPLSVGDEDGGGEGEKEEAVTVTPRTYQLEMLEESLKRNVIVAVCLY